MKKAKHHRIYKAVRNYLLNEMGLTKEKIEGMIRDRIEEKFQNFTHSFSDPQFDYKVEAAVRKIINEEVMRLIRVRVYKELEKDLEIDLKGTVKVAGVNMVQDLTIKDVK